MNSQPLIPVLKYTNIERFPFTWPDATFSFKKTQQIEEADNCETAPSPDELFQGHNNTFLANSLQFFLVDET